MVFYQIGNGDYLQLELLLNTHQQLTENDLKGCRNVHEVPAQYRRQTTSLNRALHNGLDPLKIHDDQST